jgi:NAD(P)-dependent dehydrogenase (short-subunit alcohol dehydrogenase family)
VGSSAVRRLQPAIAPYVSSKLAIEGLTRAAAFEYAGQGIRTNALVFGVFDTPLSRAFYAQNPEIRAVNLSQHRVGRFGDCIEDAGTAALYLLSRASAFMAGSIFELDGGLHL